MKHYDRLISTANAYFSDSSSDVFNTAEVASFTAHTTNNEMIVPVLEELLLDEDRLTEVSKLSYAVSPVFTKLMLHRNPESGWGVRIHLFAANPGDIHEEPWHEHRWMLGSSVLSGKLHSTNGIAKLVDPADPPADALYKYEVPDKRKVGAVIPVFTGRCILENTFDQTVTAGTSYGHHVALAHALTITEPTVTAVLTAPDARNYASFIEPVPLQYAERPVPTPLNLDLTAAHIREALRLIETADTAEPTEDSPFPELLAIHRQR